MPNYNGIENITQEFLSMIKLPEKSGRELKYLMVMPTLAPDADSQYGFPVGLALVTAALKVSKREVFTLNLNYKSEPIELLRHYIIDNRIDVIMTGGVSSQYLNIKTIIDTAKEAMPDIIAIVGGAIITADPPSAMRALENAD